MINSPKILHHLVKLGLSLHESLVYVSLLLSKNLTAKQLAMELDLLPAAVHRLLRRLENKGFVIKIGGYPAHFQALPPQMALELFGAKKMKEIQELSQLTIKRLQPIQNLSETTIEQAIGKEAMFEKSLEMIKSSKREVLIISIGESVPDEIKIANVEAVRRGVKILFIAHFLNQANKMLLDSWLEMGLEVKHLPGSGYHLQIVDSQKCLIAASNPNNTGERSIMVISSSSLSQAMRSFFYTQWQQATPIK